MLDEIEQSVMAMRSAMEEAAKTLKDSSSDSLAVQEAIELLDNENTYKNIHFNLMLMKAEVYGAREESKMLRARIQETATFYAKRPDLKKVGAA